MVLYQGKQPWSAVKNLHQYLKVPEFMQPYTPQFQYEVMDLSHLSDDQIQGELLVKASLLVMKHVDANQVEEVLNEHTLELFQELLQEKTGLEHIETILYYLFTIGRELDKEKVVHMIQKLPEKPELKEVVMTLAEQWKEEGREKGREEGIKKGIETGRKKGQSQLVMKQLQFKFREKATPYLDRLEQASQKELELIAERILTISDISSVFEGIGE
jgi:predicted transposase YdaD